MKQSDDNKFIPMTSVATHHGEAIRDDLYYYTNQIVNIVMIGNPEMREWVLIDTGMPKCGKEIESVATRRFGEGNPPRAIILTHGHFDHVGNVVYLLNQWNVPVYAHPLEFPYLTGQRNYPEPDTTVEGGLLAKISFIYPHESIDIGDRLHALPDNGELPFLPDWKWIHTPGHAPGQIALFRENDGTLLSADAFVTVRQDSLYKVLVQKKEINGPPRYLTTDWDAAYSSIVTLRDLHPQLVISGHGQAMEGTALATGLDRLIAEFDEVAKPDHGKFL